jgi:hypothetical protein
MHVLYGPVFMAGVGVGSVLFRLLKSFLFGTAETFGEQFGRYAWKRIRRHLRGAPKRKRRQRARKSGGAR